MHVCTECGRVNDEDSEFCFHCGSVKGANIDPELIPPQFRIVSNDRGTFIVRMDVRMVRIALLLALLPGILNIFGLGHLALRKYVSSSEVRKEKSETAKTLGEVLRRHRTECRMTQEFVAESLGVSRQAVSKWESGASDPSTANLMAAAKLYGTDAEQLLREVRGE